MNTAKEEALQMLKNNSLIKAAETLKTKSAEKALPAKEKFSLLKFFDVSPAFEENPEDEATVIGKIFAAIFSIIPGAPAAYLICGLIHEGNRVWLNDIPLDWDIFHLFLFSATLIPVFFVMGLGVFVASDSTSNSESTRTNNRFFDAHKSLCMKDFSGNAAKIANEDWEQRRYSPSYSGSLGNIHHRS